MTLTTDQALTALRAADPATGSPASGLSADAVVAGATQPTPGTAVSNIELHVAARQRPGRGHRLRTGLAVAATVVALAGLAIGVTHGNRVTHGPAPTYSDRSVPSGPIGAGRPAWSILSGVTTATVSVAGRPTNAGASAQFIVASLNALRLYGQRYDGTTCPPPATVVSITLRSEGGRIIAVASPGPCRSITLAVPGHSDILVTGADLSSIAFGLYGR